MDDPVVTLRITASRRDAVADRLRSVLSLADAASFLAAAERLKVSEAALRAAVDERWPQQSLSLLAAVVQHYGVDPKFLLTGNYDAKTHWLALENDRPFIERLLLRIAAADLSVPAPGSAPDAHA